MEIRHSSSAPARAGENTSLDPEVPPNYEFASHLRERRHMQLPLALLLDNLQLSKCLKDLQSAASKAHLFYN